MKPFPPPLSLRVKIAASILLVLIVGLGGVTYLSIAREEIVQTRIVEQAARNLTNTVERLLDAEMLAGRTQDVQRMLEDLKGQEALAEVRIATEDGRILRSTDPGEIGRRLSGAELADLQQGLKGSNPAAGDEKYTLFRPIFNRAECQTCHGAERKLNGILAVSVSLTESRTSLAETRRSTLMAAAFTLLAAFSVVWVLLSHWMNRPIQNLVASVARVEKGDFSTRAEVQGADELGRLALNFNSMVERLSEAQGELESYHAEQMQRADALANIGELAAGLAHEIKNPLAGIAGAMQILSSDLAKGDPKREVFEEIAVQVKRIEKTVTDLLSFARPQPPEFARVNLNEVFQAALFLVRQQSEAKRITFQEDLATTLPLVSADPRQIQQVLLNLILNAVQAMPAGGKVVVRTQGIKRPEGPGEGARSVVEAEVEDTGPGIMEDIREHIFEPFFTTKHKGTGLGLAIVRRIVLEHGGEIKVKSLVGHGTTFTVILPEASEG
jgi:signal transduction histidine kinase